MSSYAVFDRNYRLELPPIGPAVNRTSHCADKVSGIDRDATGLIRRLNSSAIRYSDRKKRNVIHRHEATEGISRRARRHLPFAFRFCIFRFIQRDSILWHGATSKWVASGSAVVGSHHLPNRLTRGIFLYRTHPRREFSRFISAHAAARRD